VAKRAVSGSPLAGHSLFNPARLEAKLTPGYFLIAAPRLSLHYSLSVSFETISSLHPGPCCIALSALEIVFPQLDVHA
jgi:hypothetical protein